MPTFSERAAGMGLQRVDDGIYLHQDRYSQVAYKQLETIDDIRIPQLGIFTSPSVDWLTEHNIEAIPHENFKFCGLVSDAYKFVGNATLIDQIKESITGSGVAILRETSFMDQPNRTRIRSEIVVSNPSSVGDVGDIYPQMIIENSYDGTKAVNIHFGLTIREGDNNRVSFSFKNKLGKIRQIHLSTARTRMSTVLGTYLDVFSSNIENLIVQNFNQTLTDEDVMKTLDVIERFGSRKRTAISSILNSLAGGEEGSSSRQPISSWTLFLAITRYSSMENNLNIKNYLENAAERVLVVPTGMMNMVSRLENDQGTALAAEVSTQKSVAA